MKTLRQKLILSLVVAMVACFSLMFAFSFQTAKADADVFAMEFGAQASTKVDGLRFRVKMGQSVYDEIVTNDTENNVKLSVIVAPKANFEAHEGTEYVDLAKKVEIKFEDETKIYQRGDFYYANAVLTNLDAENNDAITSSQYDIVFSAIGVIATTADGETTYKYADFVDGSIDNHSTTQYNVLQAAVLEVADEDNFFATSILAENSPYANWFGTEEHPVVVDTAEKLDALVVKGQAVDFTSVVTAIRNDFGIADRTGIPANAKITHKVNFYDGEELLDSKWVADGDAVVAPEISEEMKNIVGTHGASKGVAGAVTADVFDGWVDADAVTADFDAIADYANVYANYENRNVRAELLAQLKEEQPNTVFFFDNEVGASQLTIENASDVFNTSFDTTVKMPGQKGSTKIEITQNGGGSDLWLQYLNSELQDYTGDYVVFDVYVSYPEEISKVWFKFYYTNGSALSNNSWSKVIVSLDYLKSQANIALASRGGSNAVGTLWLGKATIMSASAITNATTLASDTIYSIGNTELEGPITTFGMSANDKGNNNCTANDAIFLYDFFFAPINLMNGEIFYHDQNGKNGGIYLKFKDAFTGKLYITAKGMANPYFYSWDEDGSLVHGSAVKATIVNDNAGEGYKTYCFDVGNTPLKKIRLHSGNGGVFGQVFVRDITIGA